MIMTCNKIQLGEFNGIVRMKYRDLNLNESQTIICAVLSDKYEKGYDQCIYFHKKTFGRHSLLYELTKC